MGMTLPPPAEEASISRAASCARRWQSEATTWHPGKRSRNVWVWPPVPKVRSRKRGGSEDEVGEGGSRRSGRSLPKAPEREECGCMAVLKVPRGWRPNKAFLTCGRRRNILIYYLSTVV